jgi:hypothetical protein
MSGPARIGTTGVMQAIAGSAPKASLPVITHGGPQLGPGTASAYAMPPSTAIVSPTT